VSQRYQHKKVEILQVANFTFFDLKKIVHSNGTALPIKPQKRIKYPKLFSQNATVWQKNF